MHYRNRDLEKFWGIGVFNPKAPGNLGILFRTACSFGASFLFTIGNRYQQPKADTIKSYRQIPVFNYEDFGDFYKHIPMCCELVGVELDKTSSPLERFQHPTRCCYLLGSEDAGIPEKYLKSCRFKIKLPALQGISLNVSSAGSMVIWDRYSKENILR